jgi:4-hydroxy 2-oxovalerate aldolase
LSLATQKFREFLKENYENVVSPDPIVRKITLSTFINTFGNGLFMTTGIIYFSLVVGLGAQKVALAFSLSGALSLLLSIPSGHFADRYPPRLIAFTALIGMGFCAISLIFIQSWWLLLIALSLDSIFEVFGQNARMAMIARIGEGEERVRIRAYTRAVTNLGVAFGTVVAGFALAINTVFAYKNGAKWLDSTMQGMGRGPGNTKTEEITKYFYGRKSTTFKVIQNLSKDFLILKNKYKWGTNKYYYLSGLYKVHPTYVQMLLSDTRYNNFNYEEIIKNLKKQNSTKFDPNELYLAMNFYRNKKINRKNKLSKIQFKKNIIIFGNGMSLKNKKIANKKLILNSTIVVINRSNYIKKNLIDLRVYCHPLRVITDINYLKEKKCQFLMPYYSFPKIIQKKILKKNVINFDLNLGLKFNLDKNKVTMPKPLGLIYALSYFISQGFEKVYIAGFDGFDLDDPFHDETQEYIFVIKKMFPDFKIISLTSTKLKF